MEEIGVRMFDQEEPDAQLPKTLAGLEKQWEKEQQDKEKDSQTERHKYKTEMKEKEGKRMSEIQIEVHKLRRRRRRRRRRRESTKSEISHPQFSHLSKSRPFTYLKTL